MIRDCKYRLPCAWCDKYDRPCLAVEREITKQEQERNSNVIECDHDWSLHQTVKHTGGTDYHYRCRKCGALKVKSCDGYIYESGEWQP